MAEGRGEVEPAKQRGVEGAEETGGESSHSHCCSFMSHAVFCQHHYSYRRYRRRRCRSAANCAIGALCRVTRLRL